jgi:hypothetical protein
MPEAAMSYYDRHFVEVSEFFATPEAFFIALKHERATHGEIYCSGCTGAVGFR